jgi:hypothetical protein
MFKLRVFAVAVVVSVGLHAQSPDPVSSAPPIKDKVATACTACHADSIITQQRLSKAAWTKEVDKMAKWGAQVAPADRDAIIEYLSVNFSTDKPPAEFPRTAASQ